MSMASLQTLVAAFVATGLALYLLRRWAAGGVCPSKFLENAKGKTVLITGGNEGLGKESARVLVNAGAKVIITSRDKAKGEKTVKDIQQQTSTTNNGSISYMQLDLADFVSIDKFLAEFQKAGLKLDILMNNAGVMHCPHSTTAQGFEMQFGVNHLGHFKLTVGLLNAEALSKDARIINLSSLAHKQGTRSVPLDAKAYLGARTDVHRFELYSQSKVGNILFTNELNRRYRNNGIRAYAVHPGVVATNLTNHYPTVLQVLARPMISFFFKQVGEGAQTQLYCAVAPNLNAGDGVTEYYADCHLAPVISFVKDPENCRKYWEISEELVKNAK